MIGLDISERSIKIVQLANRADRRLLTHCWQEVPPQVMERGVIKDAKQMQQHLRAALDQCRIGHATHDAVVASVPEMQSFLRVLEIPVMAEDEISEAVKWEVAQHIPFGVENVYVDWQLVHDGHPPKPGKQEVLVGAAEKSVIEPLLSILHALHLDVAALELESQAIVRALISRELGRKKGLLVVDLGGSATNVIVYDDGTIRFTASLQKGAYDLLTGLSPEERTQVSGKPHETDAAAQQAIGSKIQPAQEELVVEVRGIVEFYNGLDATHEVREIVLTGGGANLPGLDRAFLKHFDNVHVQRGNPWVNVLPAGKDTRPPMELQESVHYSTALGLALRPTLL